MLLIRSNTISLSQTTVPFGKNSVTMRFKILLLLVLFVFLIIDDSNAKSRISGGRRIGSSSSRRGGSSSRPTYSGTSRGSSSSPTINRHPVGSGTGHHVSPSTRHPPVAPKTDINTQLLKAEGGGATRPVPQKPAQPSTSNGNSFPLAMPPSTINRKPGTVTESMQTSPLKPSAPSESIMKSTGTLQNQGYPAGQTRPPWSNPGVNQPIMPSQTYPSWSHSYPSATKPNAPASQPPPIGFEHHVNRPNQSPYPSGHPPYPTGHPSYPSGHPPYPTGHPSYPSGHPPYPTGHPSYPSGHPSYPSGHPPYPTGYPSYPTGHPSYPSGHPPYPGGYPSAPIHLSNSMPLGNPYSMQSSGHSYKEAGQVYYPQQTHVIAQPASHPFVPGQTILMMPGQQDSGRGLGQMVKEALVYSTISAGVNRFINPHTHHYVESRPETAPSTTNHITYNYFNATPGMTGSANPVNAPPGTVLNSNPPSGTYAQNVGANSGPVAGNQNTYTQNVPNSGVPSSVGTNIAGTNAEVDRARTAAGGNVPITATGSNTQNNQNNSVGNSNGFDNSVFYRISDKELFEITEELFSRQSMNLSKHIKLNLQTHVTPSANVTDEAKEPLFYVEPELFDHPTIYLTKSLYDSYEHDFRKKVKRTIETRKQEDLLMDTFLQTNVMSTAMNWLADRGFIDPDDFERKDVLRRIWFTVFSGSSCGFERVFASESYDTAIVGVQDWIYFAHQESLKRIDYMGYVDKLDLGNNASLLKLNFQMDGIASPNATIFVGTLPELEMSLYTICFYARSNNLCPVSLGGAKFNIYTHSFMYFGNEILDLGLPMF